MPEFVRVTNESNRPFDFHQNNKKRIVPPGGDVIIPWNLAAALFGNPSFLNIPPENMRQMQYQKTRALYGFSPGLTTEEAWEHMKPQVTVTDLETSERIIMLMDDPEGIHLHEAPALPTNTSEVQALQAQIASLQAQMQAFINQATGPQQAAAGTTQSPTVTSDAPPQVDPPVDPMRNPAFETTNVEPFPVADLDLMTMGIELPDMSPEPSDDSPQTVTTGDVVGPATQTATRRTRAPKA